MKKFLVKAYNVVGKEKTLAGEREIDQPENLAEAVIVEEGKEDEVLAHYWAAKVIDVQRQLRAKTGEGAKAQLSAILAVAKSDPKVAELLKAANIKLPWEKVESNNATPPAPTPSEAPTPKTGETQVSPTVRRRRK
jgi:hypothetical protein